MAFAAPGLKRQLFGYSKSAVHQVLADREHMFSRAVDDAKEARSRLAEANERLGALRADLEDRSAVAEAAVARSTELEAEVATLQQRIADQVELSREAEARITAAEMELKLQRDAAVATEARVIGAEERARRVELDLDAARSQTTSLYGEIAELRQQLDEKQTAVGHANSTAEMARAEAAQLRDESMQLQDEIARLRDEREQLRGEIARLRDELEQLRGEIARLEAEAARPAPVSEAAPLRAAEVVVPASQRSPSEEIAQAIEAADEAVSRIFESGRHRVTEELERAERRRDEVEQEIARLEARHEEMEHTMAEVRHSLGDARQRITTVEEHLHQALDPLTLSLLTLGDRLARLDEATVRAASGDAGSADDASAEDHGGAGSDTMAEEPDQAAGEGGEAGDDPDRAPRPPGW